MACGFCKSSAHTIRTCSAHGAEGMRNANAARAEKKRREKVAKDWDKYSITEDCITLDSPKLYPGRVNCIFSKDCESVEGAVNTAMPDGYFPYIVTCMNMRISKRNVCAELRAYTGRRMKKTPCSAGDIDTTAPQKGRPAVNVTRKGIALSSKAVIRSDRRKRRRRLEPTSTQPTTVEEFKKFLAILLYTSTQSVADFKLLWKTSHDSAVHTFPRRLMSRDRFCALYACFSFADEEMTYLESVLDDHLLKVWTPANGVCVDETLVPFKGRGNPNHVFIMRKPHPHGTKLWTSVDYSGYFLRLCIFRRGGEKESPTATVMKMIRGIAPESLVITDSYFGGLRTLEGLSALGHYGLMSCKQTQPSFLFKDLLVPRCVRDGDCHTAYGVLNDNRPFLANVFMSRNRKLMTLTSAYSVSKQSVCIEALIPDDTEEDQMEMSIGEEERPEARNLYSSYMDFNDVGNGAVMRLYPTFRKRHWSSSVMMWVVMMLVGNNAYKLYQSATGAVDMSRGQWMDGVRRILSGQVEDTPDRMGRKIFTRHPASTKVKGAKDLYCSSCISLQTSKRRRTRWRCPVCGPICKVCERDSGRHITYANVLSRKCKRTYYAEGRSNSKRRKIDAAMVDKLVY